MQITLIGCPFKTSYGAASEALKKALQAKDRRDGPVGGVQLRVRR